MTENKHHLNTFTFSLKRNARSTMKPNSLEDSVFLPERTHGKRPKVMADEVVHGEYGLVINGHSLVHLCLNVLLCQGLLFLL